MRCLNAKLLPPWQSNWRLLQSWAGAPSNQLIYSDTILDYSTSNSNYVYYKRRVYTDHGAVSQPLLVLLPTNLRATRETDFEARYLLSSMLNSYPRNRSCTAEFCSSNVVYCSYWLFVELSDEMLAYRYELYSSSRV